LRRLCGGTARAEVDASDVGTALHALLEQHPALREMVGETLAADSPIRLFHAGVDVTGPEHARCALATGDELTLFHPVAGG
jgi:molybdopterin converting factor small subunit